MGHELDTPNLHGHLPHLPSLCYSLPLRRTKWDVVGKDNCTLYRANLLSDLRISPPNEDNHLRTAFLAVRGKCLDRLARCERAKCPQRMVKVSAQ
ncbi:hypothetical protein AVEN_23917-1 [Araneus ventricosus]|uniref:Uncharacterized protein n=1 Tax=Araneus ventricosus TaxID=182803 RepID=A0A4Y2RE15_ARAVE|nr:hypothetical protein AVEN_23917-1 [Araneus ventricosus]